MTIYTPTPQSDIPATIWFECYNRDNQTKVSEISLQDIKDHGWDLVEFLDTQIKTGRCWKMTVRRKDD